MAVLRALILLLGLMSAHGFMSKSTESTIPMVKSAHKYEGSLCANVMCLPVNHTLAYNVCAQLINCTSSTYSWYLSPCSDFMEPSYCELSNAGCSSGQSTQIQCTDTPGSLTLAYPGERCSTNSTCNTNVCSAATGLCVGVAAGSFCLNSPYCGQGLYCSANKCIPQVGEGQSCTNDYQCQNTLGCNTTSRAPGTCVPYLSVPLGGLVANCGNDDSYQSSLCTTGSCYLTEENYDNGAGICMDSIRSVRPAPQTCNSDSDCVGSTDGDQFIGSCECGVNALGYAYCTAFPGDHAGQDMLYYYSSILQANLTAQCNTMHRWHPECFKALPVTWGETAALAVVYYQNFPYLQNNDICVQEMITNFYWYDAAQVLTLAALLLAN